GRRPLLLLGFALGYAHSCWPSVRPIRRWYLDKSSVALTGAVIGVLTVIVVADLTAGTGPFNTGCTERYRRLAQHERHGFRLSGARPAPGLFAARDSGCAGDALFVDVP